MTDISQFTEGGFDPSGYIEAVIVKMGLDGLTEDQKASLRQSIGERLEREIVHSVVRHMGQEQFEEFKKEISEKADVDPADALMTKVMDTPGIADKLKADLEALFDELTAEVDEIKDKVNKHNEGA